jgi:hypothetical protein
MYKCKIDFVNFHGGLTIYNRNFLTTKIYNNSIIEVIFSFYKDANDKMSLFVLWFFKKTKVLGQNKKVKNTKNLRRMK